MKDPLNDRLASHARIWLGDSEPGPQTRLFRRTFELLSNPTSAELLLYAESIYNVWVNGQYMGRGPSFHHPTRLPCDRFDLTPLLKAGKNVITVVVHTPGLALHNSVITGEPGLIADLTVRLDNGNQFNLTSDARWRCTDQTGWQTQVPRRGWAIGFVECFDTSAGTQNWHATDFDDSQWKLAEEHRPGSSVDGARFVSREVPMLRSKFIAAKKMIGLFSLADPVTPLDPKGLNLAALLMQPRWIPPENGLRLTGTLDSPDGMQVSGLENDRGAIVCFDLGEEYVGQIMLECECPTAGVIDVGWSELVENYRPSLLRKGVSYVDRILTGAGKVVWQPMNFSGMRYLALVFRHFTGPIRIRKVGILASEPDVSWTSKFSCSDEHLNQIWAICERSLRVGTQEGLMDCPTREQAPYVGDGHLIGRWFAQLTGDTRHWRYLVHEQFRRQSPGGLVRASVFSGSSDTLIDYTLHGVIGTRDYCHHAGDVDTARDLLAACRRALDWFLSRRDEQGLLDFEWKRASSRTWETKFDTTCPSFETADSWNMFIDHPGMGWHNVHEAGMDRRGKNTAINALIVMTIRAVADLEAMVGRNAEAEMLRADAERLATTIGEVFYDSTRKVFADGLLNGALLAQISEQTNTLAIAAGCCSPATAASILQKLLRSDDVTISRNGPYFWAFLYPLLVDLGLTSIALDATHKLWGRMIAGGASTLWESFNGDHLDSLCHPWSAAPLEFCLNGILGIPRFNDSFQSVVLRPRFDLLAEASGTVVTRRGTIRVGWAKTNAKTVTLTGRLPDSVTATVLDPTGKSLGDVRGEWALSVPV